MINWIRWLTINTFDDSQSVWFVLNLCLVEKIKCVINYICGLVAQNVYLHVFKSH